MSKIRIYGDTSGYVDLAAPAVADNRNIDIAGALDSKLDLAGGKILQIVRATDATSRSTTSTSFVDASISVSITPQKSDSSILIIWSFDSETYVASGNVSASYFQITDASNNAISGAQGSELIIRTSGTTAGVGGSQVVIAYASPSTTSVVTYKGRYRSLSGCTTFLENNVSTGQMFAIEVSA